MGNPNPKHKFAKGNDLGKTMLKGKPKKKTIIKKKIEAILNWDEAEKIVEKNIMELLTSKNRKEKMEATKAFVKFFKPKKKERNHKPEGNLVLRIKGLTEEDF